MVRVRSVSKDGVGAIMIDGHAPEADEFESLPWGEIRRSTGLNFSEWLDRSRQHQRKIKKHYNENTYLTSYQNAIKGLRRAHCPLKQRLGTYIPRFPEPLSVHFGFTTGHTLGSIENKKPRLMSPQVREAHLPVLQREYRRDEEEGKLHYLQNVILYPCTGEKICSEVEECCQGWIDTLHFNEKTEDTYLDLNGFTQAWSQILQNMTWNFYKSFAYRLHTGFEQL